MGIFAHNAIKIALTVVCDDVSVGRSALGPGPEFSKSDVCKHMSCKFCLPYLNAKPSDKYDHKFHC